MLLACYCRYRSKRGFTNDCMQQGLQDSCARSDAFGVNPDHELHREFHQGSIWLLTSEPNPVWEWSPAVWRRLSSSRVFLSTSSISRVGIIHAIPTIHGRIKKFAARITIPA